MARHPLKILAIAGVSGLAFLIPLLLIAYLLEQSIAFLGRFAAPIARLFPERIIGMGTQTLVGLVLLVAASLAAGLFAHTRWGQAIFDWLGDTLIGALPQFVAARGISRALGGKGHEIIVVLVPIGSRWSIGFAFGRLDGSWVSVYLPNAPRCASGSVTLVRRSDIHVTGMDILTAVRLIRRLGDGAERLVPDFTLPPAPPPH